MIFFGWGRKAKTHQLSPHQALVLGYSYFHLFWLFRITVPQGYSLATLTEAGWAQQPLSPEDSVRAAGDLSIHWWWRWGLLIAIGGIIATIIISLAVSSLVA